MTDHDAKKVTPKVQQIPLTRPTATRNINSSTPLFIEPQISRHLELGCFIGDPLNENNTTC